MASCKIKIHNLKNGILNDYKLIGSAILTTDTLKIIRGINIYVRSWIDIGWSETVKRRDNKLSNSTKSRINRKKSLFLYKKQVMGEKDDDTFELYPGVQKFNFELELPYNIPYTFKGYYGEVKYDVLLIVDDPWRASDIFVQEFSVHTPLDLNADRFFLLPMEVAREKNMSSCYGDEQLLKAEFISPYCGYAAGQKIPFILTIENNTNINCEYFTISLKKHIQYKSLDESDEIFETFSIASITLDKVKKLSSRVFKNSIRIPLNAPNTQLSFKYIQLSYYLEINIFTVPKVLPAVYAFFIPVKSTPTLTLKTAVTIGSMPIEETILSNIISSNLLVNSPSIEADQYQEDGLFKRRIKTNFLPKYPIHYKFKGLKFFGDDENIPADTVTRAPIATVESFADVEAVV